MASFPWVKLDIEHLLQTNTPSTSICLLALLAGRADAKSQLITNHWEIQAQMHCSKRHSIRVLQSLEESGWITKLNDSMQDRYLCIQINAGAASGGNDPQRNPRFTRAESTREDPTLFDNKPTPKVD